MFKRLKNTLLIKAATLGGTHIVKIMLAAGADVHAERDLALNSAAENGHTKTVKVLLKAGADINFFSGFCMWPESHLAHTETVKALLAAGANANAFTMRSAACRGYTETVKAFLAAGADVRALDAAAVWQAERNGHTETVKVMREWIGREKIAPPQKATSPGLA